jgi:predicted nuclease of predicted toxin-antitoxin system
MRIWVDAQISPHISDWICKEFSFECIHVRDLGLLKASDSEIFNRASNECDVIISKDADFVNLLNLHGKPPSILWLTCGNTSNNNLKIIFKKTLLKSLTLIETGESLVEISDY